MSHHPGCPKNQSLYAHCECAAIDQRNHTEALNRHADQMRETTLRDIAATASLHEEIGALKALLKRAWQFPDCPCPPEGCVSDSDDIAAQDEWREEYAKLDAEVKAALQ